MSGYNIDYFVKDFGIRTQYNYQFVKQNSRIDGPYEVTQLINSFLGLIIIPNEKYKTQNQRPYIQSKDMETHKKSLDEIIEIIQGCERDRRYRNDYPDYMKSCRSISDKRNVVYGFIRHLRNATAHGGNEGIHFLPIESGSDRQIKAIIFYDCYRDNHDSRSTVEKSKQFCIKLHINEIEKLIDSIKGLYSLIDENTKYSGKIYNYAVELLEKYLENGTIGDNTSVAEAINVYESELNKDR